MKVETHPVYDLIGAKNSRETQFFHRCNGQTDGQTDGRMDGTTDRSSDRDAFLTSASKKDFVMDGPTDQWIDKKWPIESRVRSLNVRGLKICNIIEGGNFFLMIFES